MTTPKRAHLSDAAIKTIIDAVVKQIDAAYLPSTGRPLIEVLERLDKIDVRIGKLEEQSTEHLPLIKSLHSLLSTGKGFAKFLTWIIALAAASATAWTAIKALFAVKTG